MTVALREFKRDKISRQNARLSLANAAYDNPSMPRRKILLSTGANNYRPPLERSKSAPKLMAIEEIIEEEDEENEEGLSIKPDVQKNEIPNCCKEDYLYPSITLGRRRCRRGHSIRRARLRFSFKNSKSYPPAASVENMHTAEKTRALDMAVREEDDISKSLDCDLDVSAMIKSPTKQPQQQSQKDKQQGSIGSDEDFESFLLYNNYDSKDPLSGDLLSYFDMKLHHAPITSINSSATAVSLHDLNDDLSYRQHCQQRAAMSLDNLADYQSDNELDNEEMDDDDVYFNQESLLATLRRQPKSELNKHFILNSKNVHIYDKTEVEPNCSHDTDHSSLSVVFNDEDDLVELIDKRDSDEGSISSGCETSSTVTTNTEELNGGNAPPILPRRGSVLDRVRSYEQLSENNHVTKEPIGERVITSTKHFKRSITLPNCTAASLANTTFVLTSGEPTESSTDEPSLTYTRPDTNNNNSSNKKIVNVDCDSDEFSDESGYCEMISKSEGNKNPIVRRSIVTDMI